jgi:hypothetical protein
MRVVYNGIDTSLIPDSYDIVAAEQEAIVPAPVFETGPLSIEEEAFLVYMQVYQVTGCEHRAATAYYEMLNA